MELFKPVVKWLCVLLGTLIGSYGGRIAAAYYRGEPVESLLTIDRAALMRPDIVPGFVAVELVDKVVKLGPWSAALVAATAAAAATLAEGPFVSGRGRDDRQPATDTGDFGPVV
jgi:hypothetical protein